MLKIRYERPEDVSLIRQINELAFGSPLEGRLVDQLRVSCPDFLSLVAEDGDVVGHILFTPVIVDSVERRITGMGLAPMAVRPDRQRAGIGSELVKRGLDLLRERKCPFVVVLGHPQYYPRFGFEPASLRGLSSPWEGIPDAAFMALVLDARAMTGVSGVVRYRQEFDAVA